MSPELTTALKNNYVYEIFANESSFENFEAQLLHAKRMTTGFIVLTEVFWRGFSLEK